MPELTEATMQMVSDIGGICAGVVILYIAAKMEN